MKSGFKANQRKAQKYSRILKRGTKHELMVAEALKSRNVWFKHNTYFHDSTKLYFPDFLLAIKYGKLVVEIDGKSHDKRKEYDALRTQWLRINRNCKVIRFSNNKVEKNLDKVIEEILKYEPKTVAEKAMESFVGRFCCHELPINDSGFYEV